MNILIDTVRIAGFRGIKSLEISLSRLTVLIGTNNSGKTSLLKALHLALGDYSRQLSEEDFHIGTDDKRVEKILIDVRIVPVNDGVRVQLFHRDWQDEFGDNIQSEANGNQYIALRTRAKRDKIKSGFDTSRTILKKWTDVNKWETEKIKQSKFNRFLSIPFIAIEAQRDIHQELKEKYSWIGKVLSNIQYEDNEIATLESLIEGVNSEAVSKSQELITLKTNLQRLNKSFEGSNNVEITPFPKKIRDLSKHFSVHFGESTANTFPMEYHGMGTRSWASMLTVGTFTDLMGIRHEEEEKPFFPILAAEEPEAHLHPNAQKTLYRQLEESKGQVIVSTHSPYLAAMAKQTELRYLKRSDNGIVVRFLSIEDKEERRRLQREVIHSRGEILFSKALILCEGETEEQALPMLFEKYFGSECFVLGVSVIGVGGAGNYLPFLKFAKDFEIPVFIFSDGEPRITKELSKTYRKVYGETDITNCDHITILENTDFEEYLISSGFQSAIESVIKKLDGDDAAIEKWIECNHNDSAGRKKTSLPKCPSCHQHIFKDILKDYKSSENYNNALKDILKSGKTKYAPAIAEKLCELPLENFPPKFLEFFGKIKDKIKVGAGI
ncbi:MAG: AAA family ATPase [Dolichospermum sp. WA123]|nr:AAA family ATPase [Dolichospermum sp. WA123]